MAGSFNKSISSIRRILGTIDIKPQIIKARPVILIMDCVFFTRSSGLIVARDPHNKQNVHWHEITYEGASEYQRTRKQLEGQGFHVLGVILDGRKGVRELFSDIPVQMCHFHQSQIIIRYLTTKPRLEASIELLVIVKTLTYTNEDNFDKALTDWHQKWGLFIKERTIDPDHKHWHYTHKRLRSAYRSLRTNLPFLFTYQKYNKFNIPNTTNSLDGYFSRLKELLRVHRGSNMRLKHNLITEILNN